MESEDEVALARLYALEGLDVSFLDDKSDPNVKDVFDGLELNYSSELSSAPDEETETIAIPDRKIIRGRLVIGKHIKVIEGDPTEYRCTICKRQFKWKHQVKYHDYCVTGKRPIKCGLCDKSFIKRSHYEYHKRTHTGESSFKCCFCPKSFKQTDKLKRHIKTHRECAASEKYICSVCNKDYSNRDSIKKHLHKHDSEKKFKCKYCNKKYVDKPSLNQHLIYHQRPKFVCEVCGKRFRKKYNLNVHLQMHYEIYPHECHDCSKTFRTMKELRQHNVVHNTDNPGFECSICSVKFGRKDNLLRHIRNCHLNPVKKRIQKKKIMGINTTQRSESEKTSKTKQVGDKKRGFHSGTTNSDGESSQIPCHKNTDPLLFQSDGTPQDPSNISNAGSCKRQPAKPKSMKRQKMKKFNHLIVKVPLNKLASDLKKAVDFKPLKNVETVYPTSKRSLVSFSMSGSNEEPIDLSITEQSKNLPDDSHAPVKKTSVIVHTRELLQANSERVPVIKYIRSETNR